MAQATVIQAAVTRNANVMHGTPCFAGTRVPIGNLFDALAAGRGLDDFLEGFPTVSREQALSVLDLARRQLTAAPLPPVPAA